MGKGRTLSWPPPRMTQELTGPMAGEDTRCSQVREILSGTFGTEGGLRRNRCGKIEG